MPPVLRLYEDTLSSGGEVQLPALPRVVFVVHGALTIGDRGIGDGEAWHGEGTVIVRADRTGATCWRWELAGGAGDGTASGHGVRSREKLASSVTLPAGELLLRCDSVAFPPGGSAYLHTHQGPGIRCLIEGGIRIDTHGRSTSYGPGSAWFESGPEPVFAQTAVDRPSRFIRVMIIPRAFMGKSTLRLVNKEDEGKPRVQQYKVYFDALLNLSGAKPRP
jgi:hypothetical protein